MDTTNINFLAVIVTALVPMALGSVWYSPTSPTGKKWMKLVEMPTEHMNNSEGKKRAMQGYLGSFIGSIVMSYVLAILLSNLAAVTFFGGAMLGVTIWFGFMATSSLSEYLFSVKPKPWGLYFIGNGYNLIALFFMGGILAIWH